MKDKKLKDRKLTVLLTDKALKIKESLGDGFTPTKMVSAGLVLFGKLTTDEQLAIIKEASEPIIDVISFEELPEDWVGKYIPIINRISAGLGADTLLSEQFPPGIAYKYVKNPTNKPLPINCYALNIEGDSMLPEYKEGDIIIIDPNQNPKSGICVILIDYPNDGRTAMIKDVKTKGKVTSLYSLNPEYAPIELNEELQVRTQKIIEHIKNTD